MSGIKIRLKRKESVISQPLDHRIQELQSVESELSRLIEQSNKIGGMLCDKMDVTAELSSYIERLRSLSQHTSNEAFDQVEVPLKLLQAMDDGVNPQNILLDSITQSDEGRSQVFTNLKTALVSKQQQPQQDEHGAMKQ
ncbi:hypothetical protein MP228_007271 [Amoeboaphelidium protococcarum]|nr:hypothetical protein MP228_007271 [Amoeboaphelidium protococcarum]